MHFVVYFACVLEKDFAQKLSERTKNPVLKIRSKTLLLGQVLRGK